MKNIKEILEFRLNQVLDEGFVNRVPLTAEYLAEKVLASLDEASGEKEQMERKMASIIILDRLAKNKSKIGDKWVDEENAAIEMAIDMLLNPVAHLTPDELVQAYEMQQYEYDKSDIKNEIDIAFEDYDDSYNITEKPITEDEIDQMAFELRRILDKDVDARWSVHIEARIKAVETVLRARKRDEIDDGSFQICY